MKRYTIYGVEDSTPRQKEKYLLYGVYANQFNKAKEKLSRQGFRISKVLDCDTYEDVTEEFILKGKIKDVKRKFNAKINCTIDEEHPFFWKEKEYSFSDIYEIDDRYFWTEDEILSYIKDDLALVAGGGYNTDHIHNVSFEITEIR